MTSPTSTEPGDLPAAIRSYLAAHAERDTDTALRSFAADAVVVDDGRTFRGIDGVRDFLRSAGAEFRYTTTLIGCERLDDGAWIVRNRLEGDFPGGVADLAYGFTTDADRITELVIAP
ncbi:nuclear transport factor 2 family protein [Iamia majanohamensis]|uniref:Nuclear transport factor 2 family protein n=1 Tax=Iamia majanohamensis TaxID=467976 RepID=A0AAF0BSS8_9ACTN|nr:nuclear transport factor 2 family protein [Iamia majanohamensis]WCO68826.1 nuclear transport factor 2 family protein [Iamia majanohamensis]